MKTFRSTAMAVPICAVGLSLAACTAAGTAAGPSKSTSPASVSSSSAATSQTATTCAGSGGVVKVDASIGSFPIPSGAQVVENISGDKLTGMVLSSVTSSEMSSFYASALPRAGYKITSTEQAGGAGTATIVFTGRKYIGEVSATSGGLGKVPSLPAGAHAAICPGVNLSSIGKNVAWVSLAPS